MRPAAQACAAAQARGAFVTHRSPPQRIVIVGCGYVGMALAAELRARGYEVAGTTTTPARLVDLESAGMTACLLDVADADALGKIVADRDAVYLTLAAGRRGASYRAVYLRAAEHLSGALAGSQVKRIIYTSSTSIYAQDSGELVDERSPTEPDTENGRVLVEAENALLAGGAQQGVSVSVVRLGGIYGPGRSMADFTARFAGQERNDGDAFLNLAHLDDIVAALTRLLDIEHHGVLNLTADEPTTRRAVFDPILVARGLPPVRWIDPPGGPRGKRVSSRRIQELLGLRLRHPRYQAEGWP